MWARATELALDTEVPVVFRKDLTRPHVAPSRRGQSIKQRGKGATEQRTVPGMTESVTGPPSLDRMANRYPKQVPGPPEETELGE